MQIKEILQLVFLVLGGLSFVAIAIAVVYRLVTKDNRQEKSEIINSAEEGTNFWKDQYKELKEINAIRDEKNADLINTLTEKVGILTGQLKTEKEQTDRLEKIFQNRNPEMEKFMQYMVTSSEEQTKINKGIVDTLEDIHAMVKEERDRELKVTSTIIKDGHGA